jgi:hypothetical protein
MSITSRLVATLSLLASAFACSDPAAPASPPAPSILGVYALRTAAGAEPPALIQHIIEAESGMRMQVYVMSDTLELDVGGHYQQRALIEVRSGSTLVGRSRWFDRGRYSSQHGVMRFESDYLQNVAFDGVLGAGSVSLVQDLVGEGTTVVYVLQPAG